MTKLHEDFAIALRIAREACGWSQAELAEKVHLSVEAFGRLERGRVLPRAGTLVRIAAALRVTTDELLGRESPGANGANAEQESRLRGLLARMREAPPEDLIFIVMLLVELQKWRRAVRTSGEHAR